MTTTNANEERSPINVIIELVLGYIMGLGQFFVYTFGYTLLLNTLPGAPQGLRLWGVMLLGAFASTTFPYRAALWVRNGKRDGSCFVISAVVASLVVFSGLLLLNVVRGYILHTIQATKPSFFSHFIFVFNGPTEIALSCVFATVFIGVMFSMQNNSPSATESAKCEPESGGAACPSQTEQRQVVLSDQKCPVCGQRLVEPVIGIPRNNEWDREGFCSLRCFESSKSTGPADK